MERAERMRHSDGPRSIEPVPAVTGNGIARRTIQVARAAWRHLLIRRCGGVTPPGGERARAALEELGGAWVKLGQALALRFDLLPADYCLQFSSSSIDGRSRRWKCGRSSSASSAGRLPLFRSFEWEPFAAASIGQVHRAELPDGIAVAVKVQRPGIREVIRADLRLMRRAAAMLDLMPLFGHMQAREFVRSSRGGRKRSSTIDREARHASVLRDECRR